MTERETVDAFARQVAEVLRRLEENRNTSNTEEERGEQCATPRTCG